jgi:hypothetical protein
MFPLEKNSSHKTGLNWVSLKDGTWRHNLQKFPRKFIKYYATDVSVKKIFFLFKKMSRFVN